MMGKYYLDEDTKETIYKVVNSKKVRNIVGGL